MIDKKLKDKIVKGFKILLEAFKNNITMNSLSHHVFMLSLKRMDDLETLNDVQLTMLCGKFDFAFPAGDYGYTKEQNQAINELEDAVYDLKHGGNQ